jgi:hypothetical protein
MLADDFEEAVERHLRQGEYLLLVVSDGIRLGVERVTQWLNDQGKSSPFKFGLVELKFYGLGDQRLVIPRTVMMTRELSRHVVVVEIKPTAEVSVTARVTDKFTNAYGGQVQETRSVKTSALPLDKLQYLSLVSADDLPSANSIVEQLEVARFAQSGTATCLRFGFVFPAAEGTFIPLAYLGKADAFLLIPRKLLLALDDAIGVKLRTAGSELGFYRQEQIPSPLAPSLNVKLGKLAQHLPEFLAFMESYRDSLTAVLQQNQDLA